MDVSLLRDDEALSSLRRSIGVSLTVVSLSHTRWDGIKADCRFLATAAGKMLRRRTTDALNEVVNRIRAVQRGGARTHLMSEYLVVLRDRHQRLLRLSSRTVVEQRLQDRPVDDPEVLRCLRAVRTGGGGPPFIHNVQLADGSFSDDPHDIDTVFRDFFSQLFCSDHLASENFAEKVRQFCGDVPACPEFLASSLVRPTDRDELFEILRAMKTGSAPGPDSLPAEFYVSFWEIFGAPLVQLVNGILETGAVPPSFKRGRVVLVPNEGGLPSDPSAWRPIALLNTDYKLLPSLLVSSLRHILPHVIGQHKINFDHYRLLYKADCEEQIRVVPKLTEEHVHPDNLRKMNVRLAVQFFSRSTAVGVRVYNRLKCPGLEDCEGTVQFTVFINNLFDALKVKLPRHGIKRVSEEIRIITDVLDLVNLTEQNSISRGTVMFASKLTMEYLRVTLASVRDLTSDILNSGADYVLTGKLIQDPLESGVGSQLRSSALHDKMAASDAPAKQRTMPATLRLRFTVDEDLCRPSPRGKRRQQSSEMDFLERRSEQELAREDRRFALEERDMALREMQMSLEQLKYQEDAKDRAEARQALAEERRAQAEERQFQAEERKIQMEERRAATEERRLLIAQQELQIQLLTRQIQK
ncbi:hypothetical protein ISCGN_032552 [Ixodes scapularis]